MLASLKAEKPISDGLHQRLQANPKTNHNQMYYISLKYTFSLKLNEVPFPNR
jgi:hypothetical protein